MANKPNLSKDGSFIDFKQSDAVPTSAKKFRQSPEIQGFYSFVHDNSLQREAYDILTQILQRRRALKGPAVAAPKAPAKAAAPKVATAKAVAAKAGKVALEKTRAVEQINAKASIKVDAKAKSTTKKISPVKPTKQVNKSKGKTRR